MTTVINNLGEKNYLMSRSHMGRQTGKETAPANKGNVVYPVRQDNGILILQSEGTEEIFRDEDVIAIISDKVPVTENRDGVHEQYSIILVSAKEEDPTTTEFTFEHLQLNNVPRPILDNFYILPRPPHLFIPRGPDDIPNLHVVISIRSGRGEAQNYFDNVVRNAFEAVGLKEHAYQAHITKSEGSITSLTRTVFMPRANNGIAQTILLLSGDGGIIDVINVLQSSRQSFRYVKPAIGLVVMGTGNALANSTGLNRGTTKGLGSFIRGIPHSLPIFTASFSPGSEFLVDEGRSSEALPLSDAGSAVVYGAVLCSWALHASLVADSDTTEYRKHGADRFQMAAKELLAPSDGSKPHVYKGKITLIKTDQNGRETHHVLERPEHMYILATLVSNLEEKLTISPGSKPLDGQLRLVHFGAVSSAEVMRILGMAFQGGGHVKDEMVGYENIDGLRIDFDEKDSRWRRVCVDGKIIRVSEGGWVEVRKSTRDVVDIIADLWQ